MDASSSHLGKAGHWLRTHPYSVGGAVLLLGLFFPFLHRTDPEWENVFIVAAHRMQTGQDVYYARTAYMYPPFMAWALIPLSRLAVMPGRVAWWFVNAGCLLLMVCGAWRLAGGRWLEGTRGASWREHLAALLGGACGVMYLENCLAHRQTDVVLGGLLIGGCLLLQRARPLLAATSFGLAAAMKCTPLLWAPYLVWRRRPAAAAWLVFVALAVNIAPDVTHPAPSGRPWLAGFYTRCLRPLSKQPPGSWRSDIIYNQSLAGSCNRWLLTRCSWAADDYVVVARPSPLGRRALRWLVLGADLLLVGTVLFLCGRPLQPVDCGGDAAGQAPLEYSMVCLLMLLLSPMSSMAHFGLLLLPAFLLARTACHCGDRCLRAVFFGALCMSLLANKDPLGDRIYTTCLWCGSVTFHALFLLAGCLVVCVRQRVGGRSMNPVDVLGVWQRPGSANRRARSVTSRTVDVSEPARAANVAGAV